MEMEGSCLPNQALSRRMTTRESPKVCNRQHGDVSPRRTLVNSDMPFTRGTLRKVGLSLAELPQSPKPCPIPSPTTSPSYSVSPFHFPFSQAPPTFPPSVSQALPTLQSAHFNVSSAHFSDRLLRPCPLSWPTHFSTFLGLGLPLPRLRPFIVSLA